LSVLRTLVLDTASTGFEELLERRRRLGLDSHDEVWDGVLHVSPGPSHAHASVVAQLALVLSTPARAAGLEPTVEFNMGDSDANFRVPDGGLHRPGAAPMWHPTAALVIEVVSPGDESWEKLPFYAEHGVDELLIVDPQRRSVDWLALGEGGYAAVEHSRLIELGRADLLERIDWPSA
jgi:Uma2 family endonuclease